MASEKLQVILELITGQYKRETKAAADATSRFADSATKAGRSLTLGLSLPLAAAGVMAVTSLARIERIGAQTDAALRSTGGAAKVTRAEIDELAGSLEDLTSVEAESITEGQNLLLTFTRIRNEAGQGNDIFDRTTRAMVDLSVAMGKDTASSAILLGKALNDPILGLTALGRAGVQFSEDQKAAIRSMVESNDLLGAQKIILGELETQFGGSAAALGETLTGKIDKVKHSFGTLAESLATVLLPTIEAVADWFQRAADALNEMDEPQRRLAVGFGLTIIAAGPVLMVLGKMITAWRTLRTAILGASAASAVSSAAGGVAAGGAAAGAAAGVGAGAVVGVVGVAGALAGLAHWLSIVDPATEKASRTWEKARDRLDNLDEEAEEASNAIRDLTMATFTTADAAERVNPALQDIGANAAEISPATLAAALGIDEMSAAAMLGTDPLDELGKAAKSPRDRLNELAAAQRNATAAFLEGANPAFNAATAIGRFREAAERLEELRGDPKAAVEELDEALLTFVESKAEAQGALDSFSAAGVEAQIALIADIAGTSDEAVRLLLERLGLLDGMVVDVIFNYKTFTTADAASQKAGTGGLPPGTPIPNISTTTKVPAGAYQHGGSYSAFRPMIVGEAGPEMLVPRSGGTVFSNADTRRLLAAMKGGGGDWNINLNGVQTVDRSAIDLLGTLAGVQRRVEARR